jgi:NAD(P)-dependent dehydrogenase (short-subunit alcohol dehydrogenase family)
MVSTNLTDKRALITGASSGLGVHFARVLASHGVSVVLAARRLEALENICADIRQSGGKAQAVEMDVTKSSAVETALSKVDGRIDILVNNAGITADRLASNLTDSDWDRVLDTNLKGTFLVARAIARQMREAGQGGVIVNIASILGLRVAGNVSAYAASKAGVVQLTKSLAE